MNDPDPATPDLATPDLATMRQIEQRVLWLATRIIDHANRRSDSEVKVGGHQASCASIATIMTALWFGHLGGNDKVAVKPHASPVYHAIKYLTGELDRSYLTMLRQRGGLQAYPSRTKDPDVSDFSTGSVGLGAVAPLFSALTRRYTDSHFGVQESARFFALVGDAELDEGNVWEAIADPSTQELGNFTMVIDLNRQSLDRVIPDIAAIRLQRFFADAGWHVAEAKYGARLTAAFAEPGGDALEAHIDALSNEAYQELFALSGADVRRKFLVGADPAVVRITEGLDDDELKTLVTDLGGHDIGLLDRHVPELRPRGRSTVGGVRVHDQGSRVADGRRPDEPRRPARPGADRRIPGRGRPRSRHGVGPVRSRFAGGSAVRLGGGRDQQRAADAAADPAGARGRPIGGDERTGVDAGGVRPGAGQPRRHRRGRRTDRDDGTGRVDLDESRGLDQQARGLRPPRPRRPRWRPIACCKWAPGPSGQHIELGISEMNLFMLLGQLGLSHDHHGRHLLPIGTVYDPFVLRGLDALIYGIYNDAKFVVAGTPAGVTLAPEGGAHQSTITASVGAELPNLTYFEPAYATEVDWVLCDALDQLSRPGGTSGYLRLSTRPIDQAPFAAVAGETR